VARVPRRQREENDRFEDMKLDLKLNLRKLRPRWSNFAFAKSPENSRARERQNPGYVEQFHPNRLIQMYSSSLKRMRKKVEGGTSGKSFVGKYIVAVSARRFVEFLNYSSETNSKHLRP